MAFLVLADTTLPDQNSNVKVHRAGTVLADDEVSSLVRQKVLAGEPRYATLLRQLSDEDAHGRRVDRIGNHRAAAPADSQAVHPSELRWSSVNPNDSEHISELESRIAGLEAASEQEHAV